MFTRLAEGIAAIATYYVAAKERGDTVVVKNLEAAFGCDEWEISKEFILFEGLPFSKAVRWSFLRPRPVGRVSW